MRVLIQYPEGAKKLALEKAKELEREGKEVILFCEPCYGACDLREEESKKLMCDKILHLGHRNFGIKSEVEVEYLEIKVSLSEEEKKKIKRILEENIDKFDGKIAIASNLQYEEVLNEIESLFMEKGKEVKNLGVILGCYECKEHFDVALFIGDGRFHALSLKAKKLYFLNLEKFTLEDLSEEKKKEEMKKYARIEKFKESKKIGILISLKKGQFYENFFELKKKIESLGKEAQVLVMDEIKEEKLLGFNFDCYLNTACPRIVDSFTLPLVNLREVEELIF